MKLNTSIFKGSLLYICLLTAITGGGIYMRYTEARIGSWFDDNIEKHKEPGSHSHRAYHK